MYDRPKFMLDANGAAIANAYLQALNGGDDRPVIAVFDMTDPLARKLVRDLVGQQMVSEFIANAACDDVDEAFVWALPQAAAMNQLARLTPNGSQDLERLISLDLLPVAIITCDALLWAGFPKPYNETFLPASRSREN